ncbi:MAG TPA: HAD-IC family P-type ATPase [Acidimicrobiales bacterium]|nr:HAD-IC family P-type ATPase [Acidimicrobiales bacterium]
MGLLDADDIDLLGWRSFGEDLVHSDHGADRLGDRSPIAGDQDHPVDTPSPQGLDAAPGVRADGIVEDDQPAGAPSTLTKTIKAPSDSARRRGRRAHSAPAGTPTQSARVFGRVTPGQKQQMVKALHDHGHTVAMTGDGVNDVLALKDADPGIAMGSGSAITRGVAQVVVLNDDFDELPSVVGEGRRVRGNIEKVASLFLVKNVYSLLLSVTIAITGWPYPFLPAT